MSVKVIENPDEKQIREHDYVLAAALMAFGEDHLDADEAVRRYWVIAYSTQVRIMQYSDGNYTADFYVVTVRPMEQIHKEMRASEDWTKTNFYRAVQVFIAALQGFKHLVDEPSLSLYIRKQDLPPLYDVRKNLYMIRVQGLPR